MIRPFFPLLYRYSLRLERVYGGIHDIDIGIDVYLFILFGHVRIFQRVLEEMKNNRSSNDKIKKR